MDKTLISNIKADLHRVKPGVYTHSKLLSGFRSQGFRYLFVRRLRDRYNKIPVLNIILRFLLKHYTYKFGFQIGGIIGKGFYIGHFGTIVVSVNARIGNYCNIAHNVTIGAIGSGEKRGAPTIGNRVWIGTGSVLVGGIKIGSDVLIAPNSYVNFDVPDHSLVIGNPALIKYTYQASKEYINNLPENSEN